MEKNINERMDKQDAWAARIISALKTLHCLLVLWFSEKSSKIYLCEPILGRWEVQVNLSSCSQQISKPVSHLASSSVQYFIMKSSNIRNIEISQQKGIWSTTPSNEAKLTKALLENNLIILIFSVQGSGHFQVTV